jgi:hypothetical protein
MCQSHYRRYRKYGDPLAGRPIQRPRGLSEREVFKWFMPDAPPSDGSCWDWTGSLDRYGYGRFGMKACQWMVAAHRESYRMFVGPIPDGASILHSCDRPICVQPAHLSLGTHADNTREAMERGRLLVGTRQKAAKLTEDDVLWIRSSGLSLRAMSEILGVSISNVSRIRSRQAWKHVP